MSYICKVVGVFNQKGGVGKTTVGTVIAEYFAIKEGKNVLVVDVDMQCNSSDYWVGMEAAANSPGGQLPPRHPDYDGSDKYNERSTIADVFWGKMCIPYETYLKRDVEDTESADGTKETTQVENETKPADEKNASKKEEEDDESAGRKSGSVDILLGHPKLLERINTEFSNSSGDIERNVTNRLKTFLHHETVKEGYDVVIIDTGPSRNPIFRAALRAATHAIIPFEPEEKSLQGINAMLQACLAENYARAGDEDQLNIIGLLPNKIRHTKLHREILNDLSRADNSRMFPEGIFLPLSSAFPERDVKGIIPKSIFQLPKSNKARQHSEAVAGYVFDQVFGADEQTEIKTLNAARG